VIGIYITGMRIPFMAAKWGPNALFCMSNRTKCILLVSLMLGLGSAKC
jgi:hypothetical protein